jgi:hypothetical protein
MEERSEVKYKEKLDKGKNENENVNPTGRKGQDAASD